MNIDRLEDAFHRIVASVLSENELDHCWAAVLEITGQAGNETLAKVDVRGDLKSVALQLTSAIRCEPVPSTVTLFWFGLFDGRQGEKEYAGYYFSGFANQTQIQEGGPCPYRPGNRYLTSALLDTIKNESLKYSGEDDEFSVLDYAVMFGAAATLSKFAAQIAGVQMPIYVGFDSGDFACISNASPD